MTHFHPITANDYQILKRFFAHQMHHLSAYSLFSIIVWSNPKLMSYYSIENDTLIICTEPESTPEGRHLILPFSLDQAITPECLYDLANKTKFSKYYFIPEIFFEQHEQHKVERHFIVSEQPEFADYIYLTEDLVTLRGNKYARQRNLIHQFHRKYLRNGRAHVAMITPDDIPDCLDFLQKWCDERDCDHEGNEDLACEKLATINALRYLDHLESQGILIRLDGKVSAFGICSHLTDDMGVLNFEKAFSHIKGLYQFLDNECARRLFGQYTYINKESDMNLPSLAQSKNSYNPVMKCRSYCLTVR